MVRLSASCFFFNDTPATEIYTLSLHDALPIWPRCAARCRFPGPRNRRNPTTGWSRSEEHTSELQSRENLVCRLLLEKKKKTMPPKEDVSLAPVRSPDEPPGVPGQRARDSDSLL